MFVKIWLVCISYFMAISILAGILNSSCSYLITALLIVLISSQRNSYLIFCKSDEFRKSASWIHDMYLLKFKVVYICVPWFMDPDFKERAFTRSFCKQSWFWCHRASERNLNFGGLQYSKGQIISECPFEIIVAPIRPTKKFPRFLP